MCGIVGYTGSQYAIPKITDGLSVLEYRGYDSAGVAAHDGRCITTVKCSGRVSDLKEKLEQTNRSKSVTCAIGHTRWATHGGVCDKNAHPHTVGQVTIVHNGIIENEKEWRERLAQEGYHFLSETDTEVAAALFDRAYSKQKNPVSAIYHTLPLLRGSYAFAVLFTDRPDEIYAVRKDSPLLVAPGEDGCYLASDMIALSAYATCYCIPQENTVICLTPDAILLCHEDEKTEHPAFQKMTMQFEGAEQGDYDTFMKKEICQQPSAVFATLQGRVQDGMPDFSNDGLPADFFKGCRHIHIVACGSAMHAGLFGARQIEEEAGIPTTVFIASEYRYHMPPQEDGVRLIVISQSGETADTLAALRAAKAKGIPTLAIVNAEASSIAREADFVLYTHAGPEIAVATTKGYCTQLVLLFMLSLALAGKNNRLSKAEIQKRLCVLSEDVPRAIHDVIASRERLAAFSRTYDECSRLFYIGRGRDYALAMEGALKLKEISYLHSEAYAAGELKHGTISLIEEGTPVIALCTEESLAEKLLGNVREVSSRGARVTVLCKASCSSLFSESADIFLLNCESEVAAAFSAMTAMQLLAYETARRRGCDVDKPRNLAKSVTVE